MAGKKKKRSEGGANWMDTYGDMVTLLLCFFVLLYSMSSIDSDKWELLVKSFNPDAQYLAKSNTDNEESEYEYYTDENTAPNEQMDEFDKIYYELSKYITENNLQTDIEISKGDGFTFITFRDNVFFDGDSYVLKDEGKVILDEFSNAIINATDSIQEIQILGHTSQARPEVPNEPITDRFLSSNRATEVLLYIQQKNIIEPSKLVSCGYGQFRPISSFDTKEARAKNRRVEILITKTDSVVKSLDEYYTEVYGITY